MLKHTLLTAGIKVQRRLCLLKAAGNNALRPSLVFLIVLVLGLVASLPTGVRVTWHQQPVYSTFRQQRGYDSACMSLKVSGSAAVDHCS
jgi:hypothetical protein